MRRIVVVRPSRTTDEGWRTGAVATGLVLPLAAGAIILAVLFGVFLGETGDDADAAPPTTVTPAGDRPDGEAEEEWAVDLVLTFDGIDVFNEMAAACKNRRPPCDSGLAGIALDRVVLSAPRVRNARFERHQIRISGIEDESTANALAAALTTEPLPRGLEFTG